MYWSPAAWARYFGVYNYFHTMRMKITGPCMPLGFTLAVLLLWGTAALETLQNAPLEPKEKCQAEFVACLKQKASEMDMRVRIQKS